MQDHHYATIRADFRHKLDRAVAGNMTLGDAGITLGDTVVAVAPVYAHVLAALAEKHTGLRLHLAAKTLQRHLLHQTGLCDRNSVKPHVDPSGPSAWNRALGEQIGYGMKVFSGNHEDASKFAIPRGLFMRNLACDLLKIHTHLRRREGHGTPAEKDTAHHRWATAMNTMLVCQLLEARGRKLSAPDAVTRKRKGTMDAFLVPAQRPCGRT
jgi:hypothetical protein